MKKMITTSLIFSLMATSAYSYIYLSDVMNLEEQQKTGIYDLDHTQRRELEKWLNDNFELKNKPNAASNAPVDAEGIKKELSFDLVLQGGKYVRLTDGSYWEIAPQDMVQSSIWLIPFPIIIKDSGNADYPSQLINANTNVAVMAKRIDSLPPLEQTTTPPASTASTAPPTQ